MKNQILIFSVVACLSAPAVQAADEQQRLSLQHELTASIPAYGVHALETLTHSLTADAATHMQHPAITMRAPVAAMRAAASKSTTAKPI